jgi:hypothetical protein
VGCHRTDGVGPFALETYEQAADVAAFLPVHVEMRHMPPMPVDGSGACNTYSNARWLADDEIALFTAWANGGAPLGDPTVAPSLPEPPPALESPDLTLDPGQEYTPNDALSDDYRCFVIDPGLTEEQFIVAYEVIPGDARIVHHAIVYQPSDDEAAAEAVALDSAEAGLGYTCFGGAGVDAAARRLFVARQHPRATKHHEAIAPQSERYGAAAAVLAGVDANGERFGPWAANGRRPRFQRPCFE